MKPHKRRFKHNLSHYNITTMDMGKLYPLSYVEALPGDTFQGQSHAIIRMSPMVRPIMHPIEVRIHRYFVPFRLLWTLWEDFITGDDATAPPTISGGAGGNTDQISSYLGIYNDASISFSAFPIRAYNMIYNEYYRDQDLVSEVSEDTNTIQPIAWEKDYFTAARAWAQKGTAVTIPIGDTAPVVSDNTAPTWDKGPPGGLDEAKMKSTGLVDTFEFDTTSTNATTAEIRFGANSGLYTDLSSASAINITDFREALGLQRYQEARARYGSRYIELLKYLGVTPRDGRLSRPEYIGGGKSYINVSEVLNTGDGTGTLGDLFGHGITSVQSNRFMRHIEEHGCIMTMCSLRPVSVYGKGLPRKFSRTTKEDFFQFELERIGAQTILNKEVYTADTDPEAVFGYTDRYREYREEPNIMTGQMLNAALDDWHLGRVFSSDPALNSSFINVDQATMDRPFADTGTYHHTRVMFRDTLVARRPVSRTHSPELL